MPPKKADKTVTRSRKGKADEQEQQPPPTREEEEGQEEEREDEGSKHQEAQGDTSVESGQSDGDVDRTHPNKEGGGDAE
ncbi:hypothetical protein KEM55_004040 [Ascosphaera atra]|nr:hypothetical protein KEM55_004040 [Ascosphaera atra]